MLSHKKYMEIQNLNREIGDMFEPGDQIIIQEKIDGSNASFQYDRETDSVICFSRNQILSPELHLRGFYEWVQKLDKERVHAVLGDNLRMFGEWLVRHTVPYPKDCYETLYCFDVFDMEQHRYLPQDQVKALAEQLGLRYVPVFYEGPFTSWEDYQPLVGKTELGGEIGEGIIIKNLSTLSGNLAYTKIVHENFSENKKTWKKKQRRKPSPEELQEHERLLELAKTVVTRQRVQKMLYKLVDEGVIPEDFSRQDIPAIF
jgi:ATP-dependent RNA circularization protein (DNA/RNA ligase family)